MTIDQETRAAVYEAIRAAHGEKVANGIMEAFPPVAWKEVATKDDIAGLRQELVFRFAVVDEKFLTLEARLGERLEAMSASFSKKIEEQTDRFVSRLLAAVPVISLIAGAAAGLAVRFA